MIGKSYDGTRVSKVRLPIVGGYGVAVASGGVAGS